MTPSTSPRAGDWVEVRSAEEIRRTLDRNARLEGLPFMPEMLRFCGRRFRIHARAHRSCDTVNYVGGLRLERTVHLEGLRCDGEGHGGCNALCLLFWKEAWLRPVDGPEPGPAHGLYELEPKPPREDGPEPSVGCSERAVWAGTRAAGEAADSPDPTYVCQATQLLEASVPLRRSDLGVYLEDITSGNVPVRRMLAAFAFTAFEYLVGGRYGIGTPLRWLYDTVQRLRGGWPYPDRRGKLPLGSKTPSRRLDLQPGELVRVRTQAEILETVDENLRNRGMGFHTEMVPFTGRSYRVLRRIERIVHEKTGKMIHLKNDAVILEDAVCYGRYIDNCRRFCPRSVYLYFREIWLERVEAAPAAAGRAEDAASPVARRAV